MNAEVYAARLHSMVEGNALPMQIAAHAVNRVQPFQHIRAKFDNQLTTDHNRNLWAMADGMSIDAAANFGIRRTLRMRGRYAYHNNPYFIGATNRLAKFVIGAGPKLHVTSGNPAYNHKYETSFNKWLLAISSARKLRVSRAARFYNGEGFNILRTNPQVRHPVKLDMVETEADQVTSPMFGLLPSQYPDQYFDGVMLDPWGNTETYHVLRQHPGAFGSFLLLGYEFDPVPARYVLHDYGRLRPAQQRGIPEATPALDLFEELRGYRKSVSSAARTASDHAGVVSTESPAGEADQGTTGFGTSTDYIEIQRGALAVLPAGWSMSQLRAEQPTTQYDSYTMALLTEIGQVADMPLFILTGDARLANMSSAYVASQSFVKSVMCDRQDYNELLGKAREEWEEEAERVPGLLPKDKPDDAEFTWRWPRPSAHADPEKMANAAQLRIKAGKSNPSMECAEDGDDFEEVCARAAADYGVTVAEYKAALFQSTFTAKGAVPPATLSPHTGDNTDPDTDPETAGDSPTE